MRTKRFISGRRDVKDFTTLYAWRSNDLNRPRRRGVSVDVEISFYSTHSAGDVRFAMSIYRFAMFFTVTTRTKTTTINENRNRLQTIIIVRTRVGTCNVTINRDAGSKDKLSLPVPNDKRTPPKNSLLPRRS